MVSIIEVIDRVGYQQQGFDPLRKKLLRAEPKQDESCCSALIEATFPSDNP